ncbi:MAG TPA: DUF4397 domain-containing protein [Terriglobales bacterium]|nr:DUF4397 domain-containing protein [Terriglobales bacterium]
MNRVFHFLPAVIIAIVWPALGCNSTGSAQARLLNASPGEATLNGMINSDTFATNVSYGTASNYASVTSGSGTMEVEVPGATSPLLNQTISLVSKTPYTIMVSGYPSSIGAIILTDNTTAPSSGNISLRIINASPSLGVADVYVVAPGTALDSVSPTVTALNFQSATNYLSMAAGSYEVYFTPTGQTVAVIDSGALSLSSGQVNSIVGLNGAVTGYTTAVLTDMN